jgi:hypothetical protein
MYWGDLFDSISLQPDSTFEMDIELLEVISPAEK